MLPYDYSRCLNVTCDRRQGCLRFVSPGRPDGPQPYGAWPGGADCDGYIAYIAYIPANEADQ